MPIKGTYYNATLGAAPTTTSHLGYTIMAVNNANNTTSTTSAKDMVSFVIPTAGTWLINFMGGWSAGAAPANLSISTVTASYDITRIVTLLQGYYVQSSAVFPIASANTTLYMVANQTSAVVTIAPIYVYITKIG